MPKSPEQMRRTCGAFGLACAERTPVARGTHASASLRIETPLQLAVVLLLVTNATTTAAAAPHRMTRSVPAAANDTVATVPCPPTPPLTWPVVLHDVAQWARAPAETAYEAGRNAYYELTDRRCPPPESRGERVALQLVDMAFTQLEIDLFGPEVPVALHEGAAALDALGNALEDKPLDEGLLEEMLMAQGGLKPEASGGGLWRAGTPGEIRLSSRAAQAVGEGPALDPAWIQSDLHDARGLLRYRDPATGETGLALASAGRFHAVQDLHGPGLTVAGTALEAQDGLYWPRRRETTEEVHDETAEARSLRCRRAPGAACAVSASAYSSGLESLLQAHHGQGLSSAQALRRGIHPDPERPGWYVRVHEGQRKPFLRFQDRYFRVRPYRLGTCERLAVHVPRVSHIAGVRLARPLGGERLVDVAESPATHGPQFMTQAEFNVRFRGFSSLDGAQVYEQAVRNAPNVHLTQAEHRAILGYATAEHPALDDFHRHGATYPWQRQAFVQQTQDIRSGLAQIAPHAGAVYRGAMVQADALEGISAGHTVYFHTFVRASGERDVAVRQLDARAVPAGHLPLLVTLRMTRGAHPIGLFTVQDEAEVLIDLGRVFKVMRVGGGELELEEVGSVRQAFGQAGAHILDLS